MTTLLTLEILLVFLYMTTWFFISLWKKRNDLADIAWGLGFILITLSSLFYQNNFSLRAILVALLVLAWGLRLSIHIFLRNKNKKEDFRYKKWRAEWGKLFYIRSYLQIFLLQGLLMLTIALPVIIVMAYSHSPLAWLDLIGLLVWLTGFYFEASADYQLKRFLAHPANQGRIMTQGVWRYSRHPNYFGEIAQWWGIFIIALSVPYGLYGIIGPLAITLLILKVSGVPMLEKRYQDNPAYQEYKKKTSIFFPLPPKK